MSEPWNWPMITSEPWNWPMIRPTKTGRKWQYFHMLQISNHYSRSYLEQFEFHPPGFVPSSIFDWFRPRSYSLLHASRLFGILNERTVWYSQVCPTLSSRAPNPKIRHRSRRSSFLVVRSPISSIASFRRIYIRGAFFNTSAIQQNLKKMIRITFCALNSEIPCRSVTFRNSESRRQSAEMLLHSQTKYEKGYQLKARIKKSSLWWNHYIIVHL